MEAPENESFRDSIGTINKEGKRAWVYPKKPSGRYYEKRKIVSYILLTFLITAPFIKINGNQFLMFNILERRFNIFGFPFWPQDFHLVVISMIIGVVFIALFTVGFGRIFCGWICPQTIFMEMVFRKIEYWIDGDYKQQIQLKKQTWNTQKIVKRVFKYGLFYLISVIIAHTFLAYIIGSDELVRIQTSPIQEHLVGFITILVFSWVFFFVFAWFREQVCLIVCPYGRLQGVMLDRNSLVVAYDYIRGEKRAKFKKNEDRASENKGDCIDCHQCVDVCPTGIDIRNGTQLECINCTACIDACDYMMENVGLEKGLIRIDSENAIAENKRQFFTTRAKAYTAVLIILVGFIIYLFTLRGSMEASILRTPGMLYQEQENGFISNLYNVKVVNKSNKDLKLTFELENMDGEVKMVGMDTLRLEKGKSNQQAFFVNISKENLKEKSTAIKIGIYNNGELIHENETSFLGPNTTK